MSAAIWKVAPRSLSGLLLNPSLISTWFFSEYVKIFIGEPEAAIERIAHAMRLSPLIQIFRSDEGHYLARSFGRWPLR
jgi:hypothetical protein